MESDTNSVLLESTLLLNRFVLLTINRKLEIKDWMNILVDHDDDDLFLLDIFQQR